MSAAFLVYITAPEISNRQSGLFLLSENLRKYLSAVAAAVPTSGTPPPGGGVPAAAAAFIFLFIFMAMVIAVAMVRFVVRVMSVVGVMSVVRVMSVVEVMSVVGVVFGYDSYILMQTHADSSSHIRPRKTFRQYAVFLAGFIFPGGPPLLD